MRKSLFPFIPFLLLVVPVLEIGVFILLGGQIGVINTLLGIVLTAIIGTILLRQQGFALIGRAQKQMDQGKIPGRELADGVMLLAAGLLLLTPGFVTDSFGFLLLVPAFRDGIFSFLKSRMSLGGLNAQSASFSSTSFGGASGDGQSNFYYQSSGSSPKSNQKASDPSIIDLDEQDFNEVSGHEAIGSASDKDKNSPWKKS